MAGVALPQGKQHFEDNNGAPAAGWKLYTYVPGTSTLKATYTTSAASVANTNPVVMDARGEAAIYWVGDYDCSLKTNADALVWGPERLNQPEVAGAALAALALSSGSSLIGLIRSGSGAVTQTVESWIQLQHIYVEEFGASEAASASVNAAAIQAAIDAASTYKVGEVRLKQGAVYSVNALPVMAQGVTLDGNWGRLNAALGAGDVFGLRMATYSEVRRLKIYVTSTSPSSQFIWHAPISIGAPNNNGDSVASPNAFQSVHDWRIEEVELHTDRPFGPVIQGMGDCSNGVIDGVYIPDSATCSGVNFDWGNVGTVSSADIPGTRTTFNANNCYTTHPHDIRIENIKTGTLSVAVSGDLGSNIVRLSACYGIACKNLSAESVTLTGYRHIGGDLGFEFARAFEKPMACKGNTAELVVIRNPVSTTLNAAYVDTLADNVYREQFLASAYSPLVDPLMHGDVVLRDFAALGSDSASTYGARIIQARGVKVRGGTWQKFDIGIWVDEFVRDIEIDGPTVFGNRSDGIKVGTQPLRESTDRVSVRHATAYGNGTAGTGYGISVQRCFDADIENNKLGTTDETTQDIGILVADSAMNRNVNVRHNHCAGATLAAYSIPATTAPYYHDQIGEWVGNTANLSIIQTPIVACQNEVPVGIDMLFNRWAKRYITNTSGDPTVGHWRRGSVLWIRDATAAASVAKSVTTSGTFGTLNGLTNVATTNTSKDVVMSLAARTYTANADEYTGTVSSATNLREGIKCSVAGGFTDATLIGISGTTLQFDKPSKVVSGAAFTTAGVVEGEIISLNTTPAISSAQVMKIVGTTVTLDTAASSTESGRTASYTAPVFKAHAAVAA